MVMKKKRKEIKEIKEIKEAILNVLWRSSNSVLI
jgi:hypothetical protein